MKGRDLVSCYSFVVRLIIFVMNPFHNILRDFVCLRSGRIVTGICVMVGLQRCDRVSMQNVR